MRRPAARHSTGTFAGNGSVMSQPPSAAEPSAGPSASSSGKDAEPHEILDTDLIEEIKKHTVLFKNARQEYEDRIIKKNAWVEICKPLFKNWENYSLIKKRETINDIQKRWMELKDEFFLRQEENRPDSPMPKKNKSIFENMSFLLEPTDAQDLEVDVVYSENDFAPVLDPGTKAMPEDDINVGIPSMMQPSTVFNLAMPSTSSATLREPIPDNPNVHFALMLVPLLDRLSSEELYSTWPEILRVIKEAEGTRKLQILQQELKHPPGMEPEPVSVLAEEPPEEERVYPSSHGRPRNSEGEIMYPETDDEDDVV